jgi:hypothetical protein
MHILELYQSASLCTFLFAVPQLFFFMRQSRMKTYLCGLTKSVFAALPQKKTEERCILIQLYLYVKIQFPDQAQPHQSYSGR